MTQYFREFSGDITGATPSDFTVRWASSGPWTVEAYGAGQALKIVDPGNAHKGVSWNDIDGDANRADVEVYVKWATTLIGGSTDPLWYVAVRADGTGLQPDNAYLIGQRTTSAARVRKRVGGAVTTISSPLFTAATNTDYHLVFRVVGSSLYARQWGGTLEDEPSTWNLVDGLSDGDVTAAGWTALVGYLDNATIHVSALGVGTGGDAAPRSAGGGATALEGAAAGVAGASAALTTQIPLAGAAAVVAAATAALSTAIPLSGQAASVSLADGVLSTQITLSGAALAQALATGALAGDAAQLDGAASGISTATGSLTTQIRLSGSAVAQAIASAGLTTTPSGLSGDAAAQASATGSLLTAIPLVGAATAYATGAGNLSTIIQLDGAAASVSSATGDLLVEATMSGAALAEALASAGLTTQIRLDAMALAQAAASGLLSVGSAILPVHARHILTAPPRDYRMTAPPRDYRMTA